MKKNFKKLPAAAIFAGAAAAGAAAAAYATTHLLVQTALDRKIPHFMKKAGGLISGSEKNSEFKLACEEAASRLASREHEIVHISAHDGVDLVGHFFPCENAKRVIIAFHGWRSSWKCDYGIASQLFFKNGCSVLFAEQRGQNNSGGDYMGFGLTERFDCADWALWAMCRCNRAIPIYLAGVSMGAATVMMASDLKMPENVRGIIADCGFTSPKAIWKHVAHKNLHIFYGLRGYLADILCKSKINMASGDFSTTDALSKTTLPVLFIHGSDDHFVPIEMTYENYKACASEKKLLVIPGADHAMSVFTDPAAYERALTEFWKEVEGNQKESGL